MTTPQTESLSLALALLRATVGEELFDKKLAHPRTKLQLLTATRAPQEGLTVRSAYAVIADLLTADQRQAIEPAMAAHGDAVLTAELLLLLILFAGLRGTKLTPAKKQALRDALAATVLPGGPVSIQDFTEVMDKWISAWEKRVAGNGVGLDNDTHATD